MPAMDFFRHSNLRSLLLWSLLLSLLVAIFCGQGVKFHAHNLGYDHIEYLDHSHESHESIDHEHLSIFHSANDLSHSEHHTGIVYEVGDASDDVLKNILNTQIFFSAFIFSSLWLLIYPMVQVNYFGHKNEPISNLRYLLFPPLRAPPIKINLLH